MHVRNNDPTQNSINAQNDLTPADTDQANPAVAAPGAIADQTVPAPAPQS